MEHNLMNPDRCACPACRVADLADVAVLAIMEMVRIEEELTDDESNGDLVGAAKAIMGMRYFLLSKMTQGEGVTA
jgi:hypothetical protein